MISDNQQMTTGTEDSLGGDPRSDVWEYNELDLARSVIEFGERAVLQGSWIPMNDCDSVYETRENNRNKVRT